MPTNKDRSAWAETALEAFMSQVYIGPEKSLARLYPGDRQDMIGDLITDLLHYAAEQGFDPQEILAGAKSLYEQERLEDE
ncbi:hypothetical protein [Aeromonas veronii]|uniref:hypothetical protein n=1 Tax=Aeromonas veronii TaxID=654 RepID=UPI003CFE4682